METRQHHYQPDMFPELRPVPSTAECFARLHSLKPGERAIIERAWECKDRHFATGTYAPMDRCELESLLHGYRDKPRSLSAFDRVHGHYPHLAPWPMRREMHRPWEEHLPIDDEPLAMSDADQVRAGQLYLVRAEPGGILRILRAVPPAAAGLTSFIIMDAADGRLDGAIHWCVALARIARRAIA